MTRWVPIMTALALAGCLDERRGSVGDTDTGGATDAATADTASHDTADAPAPDAPPALACECPDGEVYRHGPCVPTLALGCGRPCLDDCDDELVCDPCAASSDCGTRDCRPACAVEEAPHAPVPEPLRVEPTHLAAGGPVTVSGTSFFVGALGHAFRLGDDFIVPPGRFRGPSGCEATVDVPTDTPPGAHVLWVSQYSGGPPWVLAGIIHVGDDAPACAQPGFPCAEAAHCCTAAGLDIACDDGRCQRR